MEGIADQDGPRQPLLDQLARRLGLVLVYVAGSYAHVGLTLLRGNPSPDLALDIEVGVVFRDGLLGPARLAAVRAELEACLRQVFFPHDVTLMLLQERSALLQMSIFAGRCVYEAAPGFRQLYEQEIVAQAEQEVRDARARASDLRGRSAADPQAAPVIRARETLVNLMEHYRVLMAVRAAPGSIENAPSVRIMALDLLGAMFEAGRRVLEAGGSEVRAGDAGEFARGLVEEGIISASHVPHLEFMVSFRERLLEASGRIPEEDIWSFITFHLESIRQFLEGAHRYLDLQHPRPPAG